MTTWAYDIETEAWTHLVCAVAISDAGDTRVMRSDAETADWYKSLPARDEVIAHAGGSFDFIQLIGATPDLSWSASMAGGAIVSCRARGHALCRDSYRLFPLSLAKWTRSKGETGLACECGKKCGGFCAIRRDMAPAKMKRLIEYCMQDARVLLRQWKEDVDRLESEGLSVRTKYGLRGTIGGVAWNTAARMAGLDGRTPPSWADYTAGRRGYYGGRCEVGQIEAPIGYRYDVHAMYPWALTLPVPTGERVSLAGSEAARAYDKHELGIFTARVHLPESDLPPLPHRYTGKTQGRLIRGRMLWATGTIEGTWSGVELRAAERHGAVILGIDYASVWQGRPAPLFKPYVEAIYASRRKAIDSGDERWASVLKWFANSLSGKLGSRATFSDLIVLARGEPEERGFSQLGGLDSRVWARERREVPAAALTWCAATLTARARVKLLDRLARHRGRWLYCDTDSTYLLDRDETDVHDSRLGTFGYEGQAIDWHAMAPKLYRYRDERGKPHVRARGVSRATWEAYETLRDGGTVTVESVARIRSSGGAFVRRDVTRRHKDAGTGRVGTRHMGDGPRTRPLRRLVDGSYA